MMGKTPCEHFVKCSIFDIESFTEYYFMYIKLNRKPDRSWCFLNFHKESVSDIIYASIFAATNIFIILLNLGCNIAVVVTLLQMRRKRISNNSPYCHRRHGTNQSKSKSIKREAETQMVIFLCAITAVFTTCWLPINVSFPATMNIGKWF